MKRKVINDEISFFYCKEDIKKCPSVYLLNFYYDDNKCLRYIGSAHEALKRGVEHYYTDLKDEFTNAKRVELKILRNCESRIEAYYYEKLYIKAYKKAIKSRIIDVETLVKHTGYVVDEYSKTNLLNKIS